MFTNEAAAKILKYYSAASTCGENPESPTLIATI